MKRKKKSNAGRPDGGLSETTFLIRSPEALLAAMKTRAEKLGISLAQVWRNAAAAYLAK